MRQNTGTSPRALERSHDVQQVSVITLFSRGCTKWRKSSMRITLRVQTGAPAFITERWIRDHKIKGLKQAFFNEFWISDGISLLDDRGRIIMQDQVHPCQTAGGSIFFLPV